MMAKDQQLLLNTPSADMQPIRKFLRYMQPQTYYSKRDYAMKRVKNIRKQHFSETDIHPTFLFVTISVIYHSKLSRSM